ncbi:hypothetical protein N9X29_01090 [Amylibacter sp.]|nr:hypothetical protein [Amylibacter sp.]|tara:strand:- start:36 stop:770 length:735 start_codon:yes stop_codon:yes gene_type:complete
MMAKKYIISRFITILVCFIFVSGPIYAEINFSRLFFASKKATNLKDYALLAQYESDEGSLFLSVNIQDDTYKLFEIGKTESVNGLKLTAIQFDGERLILKSSENSKYSIKFNQEPNIEKSDKPRIYMNDISTPNLIDDEKALKVFKEIAKFIGIPNFISSQFTELPKQVRTNGGREGWLLNEKIPNILLLTSPFKSNDIIVTIDGVSANNINKLKQHLSNKNNTDFFDVEIQRSGNLKMIRIRL